jgi:iron complex outermembrane recepter protein
LMYGNMLRAPSNGHRVKLDVAGNVPLGQNAALRVTGFVKHDDAYAKNVFQNQNFGMTHYGVSGKISWEPAPSVRFLLSGDYSEEDGAAESVLLHRWVAPGGTIAGVDALAGIVASPTNNLQASDGPVENRFKVRGASLKAEIDIGEHTLSNIVAYRKYNQFARADQDAGQLDAFNFVTNTSRMSQFSNELRLTSPTGGFARHQVSSRPVACRSARSITRVMPPLAKSSSS